MPSTRERPFPEDRDPLLLALLDQGQQRGWRGLGLASRLLGHPSVTHILTIAVYGNHVRESPTSLSHARRVLPTEVKCHSLTHTLAHSCAHPLIYPTVVNKLPFSTLCIPYGCAGLRPHG